MSKPPIPRNDDALSGYVARMRLMVLVMASLLASAIGLSASSSMSSLTESSQLTFIESVSPPNICTLSPSALARSSIDITMCIREPPTMRSPYVYMTRNVVCCSVLSTYFSGVVLVASSTTSSPLTHLYDGFNVSCACVPYIPLNMPLTVPVYQLSRNDSSHVPSRNASAMPSGTPFRLYG